MGIRLNQLVVGDTWSFAVSATDYPASAGWTLTIYLTPRFTSPAQTQIQLTSTAEGDSHRFAQPAAATASFKSGRYGYATRASKGAEVYTLDATEWGGEVELLPDPSTLEQGADGRTQAQRALDELNAALATYTGTNGHVSEYEINGRRMRFRSTKEITEMIDHWQKQRAAEIRADAVARGMADPRKVYVAFNR